MSNLTGESKMPADNTAYRIDKLKEIKGELCPKKYRIPCGMNSIAYLGSTPPSNRLIRNLTSLTEGMVYIMSKWNSTERDYIPYKIIFNTEIS